MIVGVTKYYLNICCLGKIDAEATGTIIMDTIAQMEAVARG